MTPAIFYVTDRNGNPVAAKFLVYNGQKIKDPNKSTAQNAAIYATSDTTGSPIPNANPDGYLIVPADYSVSSAMSVGSAFQSMWSNTATLGAIEDVVGVPTATLYLTLSYLPGGVRDLQRTYNGASHSADGFVKAFTDAGIMTLDPTLRHKRLKTLSPRHEAHWVETSASLSKPGEFVCTQSHDGYTYPQGGPPPDGAYPGLALHFVTLTN